MQAASMREAGAAPEAGAVPEVKVSVRAGEGRDVAGLMALERASEGAPHWSEAIYRAIHEDRAPIFEAGQWPRILRVAEVGEELAGFGVASGFGFEAELESVVVATGWRRRGIGRRLCEDLMRWAAEKGATTMHLEVRSSSVAVELYRQLGFHTEGLRRRYYLDPVEDALIMSVRLA